jgi:hypothetical protein
MSKQFFPLYSIKKTALIKSCSALLISLLLLVFSPLLTVKAYSSSSLFDEGNQKKDTDSLLTFQNKLTISKEKEARIVVFKEEGGSLHSIAMKQYKKANETLFDLILQANSDITNIRQINDDQKIALPVITEESYVKKVSDGNYRVYVGTFKTSKTANVYFKKLSDLKKVLILYVHEFSPKDTWHRLMISHFNSKEDALKMVNLLNKKGIIYIPPKTK